MTAAIYVIELVLYIKLVEISPELCIFRCHSQFAEIQGI